MLTFSEAITALVLVAVTYWWISWKRYEKKLKWIPKAPGHPIFGNVMEFGKTTDTLRILSNYVKQTNGICSIDLMMKKLIVITNVELAEFLLTSTKILDKSSEYRFFERWMGDGILLAKAARWRKTRKIITPAFHFGILSQFITTYDSNGDIMVKLLEKELDKESTDIYNYVTMCTLDIIYETSMGLKINAQMNRQSEYAHAVREMCRITIDRSFSALKQLNALYPLTTDYYKELKYVKFLHSNTDSVILARKKLLESDSDPEGVQNDGEFGSKKKLAFLDLLLQSKVDGKPLPDWYIKEEVNTLLFEGHDTTGSAISYALYSLAENPEVQAQAIEEQRKIFGTDRNRPTTFADIQVMKYLELVIKETLRLYPSVPFYGRTSDVDIKYKDGQILPKGSTLLVYVYEMHRDPKIFPEPEKFDPMRFDTMDRTSPFVYLPFSAGPRNCIGQKFAMHEMKVIISKVLRNYELLPAVPRHKLELAAESVLKSVNGVKIKLRPRKWD